MVEKPRSAGDSRCWAVWGLSALFVVYNFFQQVVPGVIGADLAREFALGAGELGTLSAVFLYTYGLLQIPVGLALDRYGIRGPLVAAVCVAALGSALFSAATGPGTASLARLVIGAGASFSFIASLTLASNWFAPRRFATLAGLTNTAAMIGAAGGGAPLAYLVGRIGWRGALLALGCAGFALAVPILFVVRDRPQASSAGDQPPGPASRPSPEAGSGSTAADLWRIAGNAQAWVNACYATAISVVFAAFGGLWGAGYVERACRLTRFEAAAAVSLLFLGAIPGSVFFGWVSDRIRRRRGPMIAAAAGGLACMCALLFLPGLTPAVVRTLLFALGFFCSANIVSYAVGHDVCLPGRAGLSLGFLNTCFYAGNAVSQPLVGWLLDRRFAARGAARIEELTAGDFRFALSSLVAALALSLIAALLLEESHPARSRAA